MRVVRPALKLFKQPIVLLDKTGVLSLKSFNLLLHRESYDATPICYSDGTPQSDSRSLQTTFDLIVSMQRLPRISGSKPVCNRINQEFPSQWPAPSR